MKKTINLFSVHQQTKTSYLYVKAQKMSRAVFFILLFVMVVQVGGYFFLRNQINGLNDKKAAFMNYAKSNIDFNYRIDYLDFKLELLKQYLQNDKSIGQYYANLQSEVNKLPVDATMTQFSVDQDLNATFTLIVASEDEVIRLLQSVETDIQNSPFQTLTLEEVIFGDETNSVNFRGKFEMNNGNNS